MLTVTEVENLKKLITANPDLRSELAKSANLEEFATRLGAAGRAAGLGVDADSIQHDLEQALQHMKINNEAPENSELSDEQLEAVVGGGFPVLEVLRVISNALSDLAFFAFGGGPVYNSGTNKRN